MNTLQIAENMALIHQENLTPEERQINISTLIDRWKERKKQSEEETKSRIRTPEYQSILKNLRERNAAKGIIIPERNEL